MVGIGEPSNLGNRPVTLALRQPGVKLPTTNQLSKVAQGLADERGNEVASFDRGWDLKPTTEVAQRITDLLAAAGEGPLGQASQTQKVCDGDVWLDLGTIHGEFHACVIPIHTPPARLGPDSAGSIAVVVQSKRAPIAS